MYLISEFSEITGLSKETLRYYEQVHLLEPAYVNPDNNGLKSRKWTLIISNYFSLVPTALRLVRLQKYKFPKEEFILL